jgi:hypothetical protein
MGHACCDKKKHYSHGLVVRASMLLALGLVLIIPACEAFLLSGWIGLIFWWGLSAFLIAVIYQDFADNQLYALGMTGIVLYLLAIPLMPALWVLPVMVSGLLLMLGLLCFNPQYFSGKEPQVSWWAFPTTERVVLLFVILHWSLSLAHFLPLPLLVYPFVLHDGLIALGLFSLTQWIKQAMQRHHHAHQDDMMVTLLQDDGSTIIKAALSSLKRGDMVRISSSLYLPIATTVVRETAMIRDEGTEGVSEKQVGDILRANIWINSGTVSCNADYPAMVETAQGVEDRALSLFMMAALGVAAIAGLWFGWSSASLAIGIQQFCLNLLVACPCVFLVVKPVTMSKFSAGVSSLAGFSIRQIPTLSRIDFMVVDRTNTTYFPAENTTEYQLHPDAKSMLEGFQKQGATNFIISGHELKDKAKEKWRLEQCKADLSGVVEKVHFGYEGKKHEVVRNLQLYGQIDEPTNPWVTRLKRGFMPYTVGVIGDSKNDGEAMKKADFSVGIGKNVDVQQVANCHMVEPLLSALPDLFQSVKHMGFIQKIFYAAALCSILTLLVLANGGFAYIAGFALPSTWICLASYATCTIFLAALLNTPQKIDLSVGKGCDTACSSHCGLDKTAMTTCSACDPKAANTGGSSVPFSGVGCNGPCCKPFR